MKATLLSATFGALLLGLSSTAIAATGEYDNMCTMGLALGKEVPTDCSINADVDGKTYCFGNEEAKAMFLKNPEANLAKAEAHYSKKQAQ